MPVIKNLAQEYIDRIALETTLAKNRKEELEKDYDVKNAELINAKTWQEKIAQYWERVQQTDKLSDNVFKDVDILLDQATKINNNIEYTLEAVQILVCNIREVRRVLEKMTDEYKALKDSIANANVQDKNFVPGDIVKTIEDLGSKLDQAEATCDDTITKVLDLLKAFLVLHRSFDSERSYKRSWIISKTDKIYVDENGELRPIELSEQVRIELEHGIKDEPGLEWNLHKLLILLQEGVYQPDGEPGGYPCDYPVTFIPSFPLADGHNRYYDITKTQYSLAKSTTESVDAELATIASQKRDAESSYTAFQAAYDAAMAAKKPEK